MNKNLAWALVLLIAVGLGVRVTLEPTDPPEMDTPAPLDHPHPPKAPPWQAEDVPLEVVARYCEALHDGDYRLAYDQIVPSATYDGALKVKAGWSYEAFAAAWSKRDRAWLQQPKIRNVPASAHNGRFVIQVDFPSGRSAHFTLVTHAEGATGTRWYLREPPFLGPAGEKHRSE